MIIAVCRKNICLFSYRTDLFYIYILFFFLVCCDDFYISMFTCKYFFALSAFKTRSSVADSVLAVNWNNGSCPKTQYLKVFVSKALGGNMIFVDSIGFDFDNKQDLNMMWSGWLDSSQLTQISAL